MEWGTGIALVLMAMYIKGVNTNVSNLASDVPDPLLIDDFSDRIDQMEKNLLGLKDAIEQWGRFSRASQKRIENELLDQRLFLEKMGYTAEGQEERRESYEREQEKKREETDFFLSLARKSPEESLKAMAERREKRKADGQKSLEELGGNYEKKKDDEES